VRATWEAASAHRRRLGPFRSPGILLLVMLLLVPGCSQGKKSQQRPPLSSGVNASFQPSAAASCTRPDQLSLQPSTATGSVVNINVMATDCDASMLLNGVNFEISFDDSVMDFIGCTAGTIFPASKLAPGTPACRVVVAGDLIGTVALALPNSFRISGGQAPLARLTFNVKQKGISSPIVFLNTDSLFGTTLFFADPVTQNATPYTLGASMYAGGTMISN
jgi:hypothetical protein